MKRTGIHKIVIPILIIFAAAIGIAHAADLEVSADYGNSHGGWYPGAKISLVSEAGLYAFLAYSEDEYWYRLPGPDFSYIGGGVGARIPILYVLHIYADVGYYVPDLDYYDGDSGVLAAQHNEAAYQILNDCYQKTHIQYSPHGGETIIFDYYKVSLDPAIGAEVGIGGKYEIFRNFSIGGSVGYRWLKFPAYIEGGWHSVHDGCLELRDSDHDAGGWRVGLGLAYHF